MENVQELSVLGKAIGIIVCIGLFALALFYGKIGEWLKEGYKFLIGAAVRCAIHMWTSMKEHLPRTVQHAEKHPIDTPRHT